MLLLDDLLAPLLLVGAAALAALSLAGAWTTHRVPTVYPLDDQVADRIAATSLRATHLTDDWSARIDNVSV